MKVALTGIQPTGLLHLGNYLGAFRPALELANQYEAVYYFIADAHALTTVQDPDELREATYQVAAAWIALGLDPERMVIYRQSDIREVFELAWIISCVTPKGLLNRAHKYKDIVDENERAGRATDDGVSMGLFNYPVLMSADILIADTNVVPVGGDNRQHLEITRDIAEAFNRTYGDVLVVPEAHIEDSVAVVPGLDGRKMSKSYGNVIPIFAEPKAQRKLVMRIVTDSRKPEDPKDPNTDNLFKLFEHFGDSEDIAAVRERYLAGGIGYGEVKEKLAAALESRFGEARKRYEELMGDRPQLDEILANGAKRLGAVARATLGRVRKSVGLDG